MITRYLTRWNDGKPHEAIFAAEGIRRLMGDMFRKKQSYHLAVYALNNDITAAPQPVRVYYDHVFDRLTVFDLCNRHIDSAGIPIRGGVTYEAV